MDDKTSATAHRACITSLRVAEVRTPLGGLTEGGEDFPESKMQKPFAIHFLCLMSHAKEYEKRKAERNLNPTIRSDLSTGGDQKDIAPVFAMDSAPAIR